MFNTTEEENQERVKELTEYQKQKIQETLVRMDNALTKPQEVNGRKFEGAGFCCNPTKIQYIDFEVGKSMKLQIELTNSSLSFNSFKLLPLPDNCIDFFEIDFKPCGRIPPGISTRMTLTFMPATNEDIFSHLRLLSETGPVNIPIECLAKKCLLQLDTAVIDFGEVYFGQEKTVSLGVVNKGALDCTYEFVGDQGF